MAEAPTRIACLTPPGRGAIAVLAVRGPRAWAVARTLFQPTGVSLPDAPLPGRFWFGRLGAELRDEVVLSVKQAGAQPWLEVQCHGGPEVVRLLLEAFATHGVESCTWQELEQLGPMPEWQQQVLDMLTQAPTARTAAILLDQYDGAFQRAIASADPKDRARLAALVPLGMHLVQPWRVVVAGAPNVGKSNLVNALAGYTRCLVSPLPGTTRDVVSTLVAIDGWPIELLDTAGQRAATEALEQAGVARARRTSAGADLRLWLVDASASPVLPEETGWQLVINKIDLPAAWDIEKYPGAWRVSALTRSGLDELCAALSRRLVPQPPRPGEGVPCTPNDISALGASA